jgi:outer membrane lipoprotein-sorting protein
MFKKIIFSVMCLVWIPAHAFDLGQLMDELGQRQHGHARFEEIKYIAILDKPLHASGELYFQSPGTLEKRTLKPKQELLALEGNMITLERDGKKKQFNVNRYPQVSAFVGAIRGLLIGNRQEIEQNYKTQLQGDIGKWILTLTPNDEKVAEAIQTVKVSGEKGVVRSIEYVQRDGDRSLMTIEPITDQ